MKLKEEEKKQELFQMPQSLAKQDKKRLNKVETLFLHGKKWYEIEEKIYGDSNDLLMLINILLKQGNQNIALSIYKRSNLNSPDLDILSQKLDILNIVDNPLDSLDAFRPINDILSFQKVDTYLNMNDFGFSEQNVFLFNEFNIHYDHFEKMKISTIVNLDYQKIIFFSLR